MDVIKENHVMISQKCFVITRNNVVFKHNSFATFQNEVWCVQAGAFDHKGLQALM